MAYITIIKSNFYKVPNNCIYNVKMINETKILITEGIGYYYDENKLLSKKI